MHAPDQNILDNQTQRRARNAANIAIRLTAMTGVFGSFGFSTLAVKQFIAPYTANYFPGCPPEGAISARLQPSTKTTRASGTIPRCSTFWFEARDSLQMAGRVAIRDNFIYLQEADESFARFAPPQEVKAPELFQRRNHAFPTKKIDDMRNRILRHNSNNKFCSPQQNVH